MALAGSKRRALLALLLVHANQTVSIERLIDELWGESPPATAARTVQAHVSRLRKALGVGNGADGVIVTRERGYELTLDPERLDALRFERLVAEGRSELAAGHPNARRRGVRGGALAVAWRAACRPRRRAVRPARGGPLGRSAAGRAGGPGRGQAGARAPRRAGRAARGADRRASLSRAPACPVDACPVSLRAPGRCAPGLPGRAQHPGRRAGDRARRASAGTGASDTGAGPGARRAAAAPPGVGDGGRDAAICRRGWSPSC